MAITFKGINKEELGDRYIDVLNTSLRSGADVIVILSSDSPDDYTLNFVKKHLCVGIDFHLSSSKSNIPNDIEWLYRPIL